MGTDSLKAQIIRFVISGGSSTALHFTVMALLIYLGIKPVYATMVGAITGAMLNYGLQYYYTFRSQKSHLTASIHFAIASGLAWLSNLILFVFFHQYLNIPVPVAQVITTCLVTIQNYFMYKFIFHHNEPIHST
jgi:putative flippase GtrA